MANFGISVAPCNQLGVGSSGSSIISISNPTLTAPPPPSGGQSSFVLNLSALSSPQVTVSPTSSMSWTASSNTVAVTGTFPTGTTGTVTITGSNNGNNVSAQFTIAQSGSPAASTTNLTVNADSSFYVTTMGSGVTLTDGVTSLVTGIPSGGQVLVSNPVFFVTNTTGTIDNTFDLTGAASVSLGTITAGSGLEVSGDIVTVDDWSALSLSQVTVPFNTNSSTSFIVAASRRPAITNGGETSLTVNSNGSFLVTALGPSVYLTGINLQYQTTVADNYGFSFDAAGALFNGSTNLTFDGGQPSFITGVSQGSNLDSFTDANTADVSNSVSFTIATAEGVLDPTILNNPDT